MTKPIVLKRFKELGLTTYEAKSYLSLLEKDTLTVAEVARIAKIPRTNAYEALEKLMSKGFCKKKPGATKKYSAADPAFLEEKTAAAFDEKIEEEISELHKKHDEILSKKKNMRENLSNLVKELKPIYIKSRGENNPLDYIEIIKDPYQMNKRFMQLIGEAKKEVLVFTKPPFVSSPKVLEEQTAQQAKIMQDRNKPKIKCIYEISAADDKGVDWWFNDIDMAVKHGEEARVIKKLPMKMTIIDEKIVMLALVDNIFKSKQPSLTTQIVEHRDLARGLKILFETIWEQAESHHVLKDWR